MLYLLHCEASPVRASHYLGFTSDGFLYRRLARHYGGGGARLTRLWRDSDADVRLAGTVPGATLQDERAWKASGHFKDFCPICLGLTAGVPWRLTIVDGWEFNLASHARADGCSFWRPLALGPSRRPRP